MAEELKLLFEEFIDALPEQIGYNVLEEAYYDFKYKNKLDLMTIIKHTLISSGASLVVTKILARSGFHLTVRENATELINMLATVILNIIATKYLDTANYDKMVKHGFYEYLLVNLGAYFIAYNANKMLGLATAIDRFNKDLFGSKKFVGKGSYAHTVNLTNEAQKSGPAIPLSVKKQAIGMARRSTRL